MTSKLSLLIDRNRLYESRFFLPCIKKHEKYCSTPTNKVLKDMFPKKRTLKIRQKIVTKGSSISESNSFTAATNQKLSNHSIIAATNRLKRLVKIRNCDITHILQKYKSNRDHDLNTNGARNKFLKKMSMSKGLSRNGMMFQVKTGKRFGMIQSSSILFNSSKDIKIHFS